MSKTTLSLRTSDALISDIQVWSDAPTSHPALETDLQYICAVNYVKIPLCLVSCGPYDVYSEHHETEDYFFDNLVNLDSKTGILARSCAQDSETHIVFYVDGINSPRIRCFYIDFSIPHQIHELHTTHGEIRDEDVFFVSKARGNVSKSDTSVFDRVLTNKTSKKACGIATPQHPVVVSAALLTTHQISQAVSRVVLSGLRIRGLSTNYLSSANDKIAIREVYHMTKQAAMFALRKRGYEFNSGAKREEKGVSFAEIQGIVESLLLVFVDVETSSFKKNEEI